MERPVLEKLSDDVTQSTPFAEVETRFEKAGQHFLECAQVCMGMRGWVRRWAQSGNSQSTMTCERLGRRAAWAQVRQPRLTDQGEKIRAMPMERA